MHFVIDDYPLPPDVLANITDLAKTADCLLIGEIHGTQEIPRIVASLLPMLKVHGYRGIGVEIPHIEQDPLRLWLSDPSAPLPAFFAQPWPDGRGSSEMLALLRRASGRGFGVFCFDADLMRSNLPWSARDAEMARHTGETWLNEFPKDKVAVLCGNNHAFLERPPQLPTEYWPTFAAHLQQMLPEKNLRSLELRPLHGEFYNMSLRRIDHWWPVKDKQPPGEVRTGTSEFVSLTVEFPRSSAATFVAPPKAPGQTALLRYLLKQVTLNIGHWIQRMAHGEFTRKSR